MNAEFFKKRIISKGAYEISRETDGPLIRRYILRINEKLLIIRIWSSRLRGQLQLSRKIVDRRSEKAPLIFRNV